MAGASPEASLHENSHRERDPLRNLHDSPFPLGLPGPGPELRRTWHRVQRTGRAARSLALGSLGSPAEAPQLGAERGAWQHATGLQDKIVREMRDLHAARAARGSISDGRAFLRRLAPDGVLEYGTAAGHSSGKGRLANPRKGDLCRPWAREGALSPPVTTTSASAAWSPSVRDLTVLPEQRMVLGSGEVDWPKHDEDYICRPVEEKTREVVWATESSTLQAWAAFKVVEKLMGSWAWIMLAITTWASRGGGGGPGNQSSTAGPGPHLFWLWT